MKDHKLSIAGNAFGILLFVYLSSWGGAPEGGAGALGGPGDPILWGLSVFPVLLVWSIFNLAWSVRIASSVLRKRDPRALWIFALVLVLWYIAFDYDRSRQYSGSDVPGGSAQITTWTTEGSAAYISSLLFINDEEDNGDDEVSLINICLT